MSVTGERSGDGGNEALFKPLMMPETTLSGDTARQVRLFDRAGRLPEAA